MFKHLPSHLLDQVLEHKAPWRLVYTWFERFYTRRDLMVTDQHGHTHAS